MPKFEIGDSVVVIAGSWTGQTGCVVETAQGNDISEPMTTIRFAEKPHGIDLPDRILERVEGNLFEDLLNVDREAFFEMAGRIGPFVLEKKGKRGNPSIYIAVGADETQGVRHFHVFRKPEDIRHWRNGACLMFTHNCYFDHSKNHETLSKVEVKRLNEALREKNEDYPDMTNWEALIFFWNSCNSAWKINRKMPCPRYDYDTLKAFKDRDKAAVFPDGIKE